MVDELLEDGSVLRVALRTTTVLAVRTMPAAPAPTPAPPCRPSFGAGAHLAPIEHGNCCVFRDKAA